MKKFFDDFKKDAKFKSAGPGKKLTEEANRQITSFNFPFSDSRLTAEL